MQNDERPIDDDPQDTPTPPRTAPSPATRVKSSVVDDHPLVPDRSADDSDTGWGDGYDSNDDRLLRDVPPHW